MKRLGKAVLVLCVFSALIATYVSAQRFGGGGFAAMRMLPLEQEWAQISFDLDATDEQVTALRKIYKAAWDERATLMAEASEAGLPAEEMTEIFGEIRKELNSARETVLEKEQLKKLEEMEEQNRQRMERFRQGGMGRSR